jgi:hypothetical protein
MKEVRDWCDVVPSPAPSRLTKALDRLDAAMAREAGRHRPVAAGHRVLFSRRRWRGWAAPLATAVAVTAVIVGALTVSHLVFGSTGKPAASPSRSYASLPRYYEGDHGIRVTATGRLILAVPDGPAVATATPDGLTFVLGSGSFTRSIASGQAGPMTFELVRITPGGTPHVSHLSLPETLTLNQRPGIALSPDGRRLAVAYGPHRARDSAVVQVITLTTGQVRQWTWRHAQWAPFLSGVGAWSADGRTLAVTRWGYAPRSVTGPQVLLLNTAAPGGGRSTRQVVLHVPAGYRISPPPLPMLTPNGAELITSIETGTLPNPWQGALASFSARTGALIGIRGRWEASAHEVRAWNTLQILAWSNWSGSKLIEVQPQGSTQVLGELSGGVFTRTGPLLPHQAGGYRKLRRVLIADSGVIW